MAPALAAAAARSVAPRHRVPLFFSHVYHVTLPAYHSFPMERYRKVFDTAVRELPPDSYEMVTPRPVTLAELRRAHSESYIEVRPRVQGRARAVSAVCALTATRRPSWKGA
jgi:acetoin utilization deacetylase AcuC-like enzyme